MNIGSDCKIHDSGEIWVVHYLMSKFPVSTPAVIFDVGTNVGGYASELISHFDKRVSLFCFEPSKKSFEQLTDKLGDYENVELFNFGFGDKEESTSLYSDKEGSNLASIYNRRLSHFGISMKHKEDIVLKRIDNFCRDKNIKHIYLLKLDVEGNELKVLNAAKSLISSYSIDFIQFEFGGCNIDSRTFFQDFFYLLNPYYKVYRILKSGLAPIEAYKETYEIFITSNFLAISRKMKI